MAARKLITLTSIALVFFVALFGSSVLQTRAQSSMPEKPWPRESIPFSKNAKPSTDVSSVKPASASANAGDERMVFVSYRNNSWNLFYSDGNGSNQTLLKSGLNFLLRPSLRYGGARIAYGKANGIEMVYIIDGQSSFKQVSYDSNFNVEEARWSTSGKTLALTKLDGLEGDYSIHRKDESDAAINAQCLTCNPYGDNDYSPTWSPNDREIIWIRGANGTGDQGELWRMSADGSNKRRISNSMYYMSNATWSRDGSKVAFDAALTKYGMNRLYVMDLTSGQITEVYNPNKAGVEAWMGSWTSDDRSLVFTRVEYVVENDQLVLDQAFIERVPATGGNPQRLTFTGFDLFPDVKAIDHTQPSSNFAKLPVLAKTFDPARVNAYDTGGSGLTEKLDVQFRIGESGVWQNVTQNSCWLTFPYSGQIGTCTNSQPGDKVYLRSRARDYAGNVEDWPTNPDYDTYTTLYSEMVTGTVMDMRGVRMAGSVIQSPSQPLLPIISEANGVYSAYFASDVPSMLTSTLAAYGSGDSVRIFNSIPNNNYHVLPPMNDLIKNGGFEQGSAYWIYSNSSVTTANDSHSGSKSAVMIVPPNLSSSDQSFSQVITLTANLHMPTLSFSYRLSELPVNEGTSVLTVTVTDGLSAMPVKVINRDNSHLKGPFWQNTWIDMSQWAGKTITLQFESRLMSTSLFNIDEISLGEWKTPVATSITPNQLTTSGNNTVIISGTNFIGTPIVKIGPFSLLNVVVQLDGTLKGALPASIPAGLYDVMVINPEGQASMLPNAFQFGSRVSLPIMPRDVD